VQRFERRIEGMVGDAFARVFGGKVVPQEVAQALQKEAEARVRPLAGGRLLAPNRYTVTLGAADHDRLTGDEKRVIALLRDCVTEHLTEYGWDTYGDVVVSLERSETLHTGQFRTSSSVDPDASRRSTAQPRTAGDPAMSQQPPQHPEGNQRGEHGGYGYDQGQDQDPSYGQNYDPNGAGQQAGYGYDPSQGQNQQYGYDPNYALGYDPAQGYAGQQGGYGYDQGQGQGGYGYDQGQGQGGYGYDQGQGQGGYGYDQGQGQGGYGYDQGQGQGGYGYDQGQGQGGYGYDQGQGQGGYGYDQGQGQGGYGYDQGQGQGGYGYDQGQGQGGYGYDQGQGQGGYGYDQGYGQGVPGGPGGGPGGGYDQNYGQYRGGPGGYGYDQGQGYDQQGGYPQDPGINDYVPPAVQTGARQLTAVLSLDDGSNRTYQLTQGSNVVGRGQDAQFRLPDTGVSRRHMEISWDGQNAVLADLGSTNGTTVNGTPVQTWQLADGDVVRVGHSALVFHVQG